MTSRRGPPSPSSVSCPVFSSMPAWRASTAPDRVGSMTKQQVSGPRNTHSHHFAGPSPSRGANTRHVVSSACRCHEPRDRSVTASATGASSAPACAHVPAKVAGEISAPCRDSPVTSEFMLRPATYRSVNSIAMNAFENRPFPIAFGGPGAVTAAGTRQEHARRYRRRQCAATRTTTRQSSSSVTDRGGSRTRPLRGPPEQHPLQTRQVSPQPLQLSRLLRVLRPQPGVLLPVHGILLAQLSNQPRHLPVRLQGRSQHLPQRRLSTLQNRDKTSRNRHAAQQTPSAAANHAPRTTCLTPSAGTTGEPAHHATSEYLRSIRRPRSCLMAAVLPAGPVDLDTSIVHADDSLTDGAFVNMRRTGFTTSPVISPNAPAPSHTTLARVVVLR